MRLQAPVTSAFQATARGDRIAWDDLRHRVDMAAVATALFGPAPKRSGRRLLWPCPFHADHDPSLQVDPAERRWRCWPCDLGGDAPALVMRLQGVGFPEAVRIVAELAGIIAPSSKPTRPRPPTRSGPVRPAIPTAADPPENAPTGSPARPAGLDRQEAERVVADASERLWRPEGAAALAYLRGRGLTEATIRAACLGWAERIRLPKRDGTGTWPLSGITIPWGEPGRPTRIKVRRAGLFRGARYIEAFADAWTVYPSMAAIRPGAPLVIAEGELDCLLLAQQLERLAAVVTLGSASSRPEGATWLAMLRCPTWYIALDADPAGDDAAAQWPPRAVRVRPPAPDKDWTEAHQSGVNLKRWWSDRLAGIEAPERSTWDELVARRWGPGLTIAGPGFTSDRIVWPASPWHPADDDDRKERAAIMEHDGALSWEATERAADLRPSRGSD
jgi:hypothetical protein